MAPSRHDWKIVDWDVKPQHNQPTFVKFLNAVKSLYAHYLFNQWPEFDQTSTDKLLGRGKEVIRYRWPWPYFQGHYIIKTLKVSLVCTLSHESMDVIWPD